MWEVPFELDVDRFLRLIRLRFLDMLFMLKTPLARVRRAFFSGLATILTSPCETLRWGYTENATYRNDSLVSRLDGINSVNESRQCVGIDPCRLSDFVRRRFVEF